MKIIKNNIWVIIIEVLLIAIIIGVVLKYYYLVNHPNFFVDKKRRYTVELNHENRDIENKIPISVMIINLGLDAEKLHWVVGNLSEDFILCLSPYMGTNIKDFISKISNDICLQFPVKSTDPNDYNGELELIPGDYETNIQKIATIMSATTKKVSGIYLSNVESLSNDAKTLRHILEAAHNHNIMLITDKENKIELDSTTSLAKKLNTIYHAADASFYSSESLYDLEQHLIDLENNHNNYHSVLLIIDASIGLMNEVNMWLEKQNKFLLSRLSAKTVSN